MQIKLSIILTDFAASEHSERRPHSLSALQDLDPPAKLAACSLSSKQRGMRSSASGGRSNLAYLDVYHQTALFGIVYRTLSPSATLMKICEELNVRVVMRVDVVEAAEQFSCTLPIRGSSMIINS